MRYTNKFIDFLNNGNSIIITCQRDFNSMRALFHKVGLDFFKDKSGEENYYDLVHLAQINHCCIGYGSVIIEYKIGLGLTFGYKSIEESEKWYEQKPYKVSEVLASVKGE